MSGVNNWRVGLPWPALDKEDHGAVEYLYEDDDGKTCSSFDDARALSALLLSESAFLNSYWWEKSWPERAKKATAVCVNCNDVFAWGCADAEEITHEQIEEVYRYYAKDPVWGVAVWCIIQRKEMPQRPVEAHIRDGGIWDLDALAKEHGLRPNHYDGASSVLAKRKYETYCEWARRLKKEVRPFDAQWWAGWKEYTEANPGWYSDTWKAEDSRLLAEFKAEAGFPVQPIEEEVG